MPTRTKQSPREPCLVRSQCRGLGGQRRDGPAPICTQRCHCVPGKQAIGREGCRQPMAAGPEAGQVGMPLPASSTGMVTAGMVHRTRGAAQTGIPHPWRCSQAAWPPSWGIFHSHPLRTLFFHHLLSPRSGSQHGVGGGEASQDGLGMWWAAPTEVASQWDKAKRAGGQPSQVPCDPASMARQHQD